jgi:hypothetical protein
MDIERNKSKKKSNDQIYRLRCTKSRKVGLPMHKSRDVGLPRMGMVIMVGFDQGWERSTVKYINKKILELVSLYHR